MQIIEAIAEERFTGKDIKICAGGALGEACACKCDMPLQNTRECATVLPARAAKVCLSAFTHCARNINGRIEILRPCIHQKRRVATNHETATCRRFIVR